jgi:hypothetical protein
MPRKPRESSGTGIYHVMLRGINRQDIFDDTEDYWTFIKMLTKCLTLCEEKQIKDMNENKIKMLFDSKNS